MITHESWGNNRSRRSQDIVKITLQEDGRHGKEQEYRPERLPHGSWHAKMNILRLLESSHRPNHTHKSSIP